MSRSRKWCPRQKMSKNDPKCKCQAPKDDAKDQKCQKMTKNVNVDWKDLQKSNIFRCRWFLQMSTRYGRLLYTPLDKSVRLRDREIKEARERKSNRVCQERTTKRPWNAGAGNGLINHVYWIDWCCFHFFIKNSLLALLEALFAQILSDLSSWCSPCKVKLS